MRARGSVAVLATATLLAVTTTVATATEDHVCLPSRPVDRTGVMPFGAAGGYRFGTVHGEGSLGAPSAIARDPVGRLVVADEDRVLRMDEDGQVLSSWGGVQDAAGVAVTPTGIVAVSDVGVGHVALFTLAGQSVGTLGAAALDSPAGIALLPSGDLAVADSTAGHVVLLAPDGTVRATWGGGELSEPSGISAHGRHLFVADTGNDRIARFDAAGELTFWMGGAGDGSGCLSGPVDVAAGPHGVFVADPSRHRIVQYTTTGHPVDAWGSHGADPGRMDTPSGIVLDGATVWVAEAGNARLQRFRPRAHAAPPGPWNEE